MERLVADVASDGASSAPASSSSVVLLSSAGATGTDIVLTAALTHASMSVRLAYASVKYCLVGLLFSFFFLFFRTCRPTLATRMHPTALRRHAPVFGPATAAHTKSQYAISAQNTVQRRYAHAVNACRASRKVTQPARVPVPGRRRRCVQLHLVAQPHRHQLAAQPHRHRLKSRISARTARPPLRYWSRPTFTTLDLTRRFTSRLRTLDTICLTSRAVAFISTTLNQASRAAESFACIATAAAGPVSSRRNTNPNAHPNPMRWYLTVRCIFGFVVFTQANAQSYSISHAHT